MTSTPEDEVLQECLHAAARHLGGMEIQTNAAGGQLVDDMVVSGLRTSGQVFLVEHTSEDAAPGLVGIFTTLELARRAVEEAAAAEVSDEPLTWGRHWSGGGIVAWMGESRQWGWEITWVHLDERAA